MAKSVFLYGKKITTLSWSVTIIIIQEVMAWIYLTLISCWVSSWKLAAVAAAATLSLNVGRREESLYQQHTLIELGWDFGRTRGLTFHVWWIYWKKNSSPRVTILENIIKAIPLAYWFLLFFIFLIVYVMNFTRQ